MPVVDTNFEPTVPEVVDSVTDEAHQETKSRSDVINSHDVHNVTASKIDARMNMSHAEDQTEPGSPVIKHEILGGDIELKFDEDGSHVLRRGASIKAEKAEPILWNHVPSASEEAALAFQELDYCTYQTAHIASTGQEEVMSCDCKPDIGPEGTNYACGEDSDCINRLTSMECTDEDCNCGARCANQRFQLREYANVDVFHAGKKGYGLRALANLEKDTFVYEYVGEVINERRFRQRQQEYEQQGEKHFYFMMLQKGEYIDATKKGGFGRFINHSCEPNCYVDKWVVGNKLRMGIFTKKTIIQGEELSFDYNVDRYGGEATPCYCGEPTCLGYIGGKTQTEAANKLPQTVVEALGIDDDDEWDNARQKNDRRRRKGQDDEEYVNELTPRGIKEKDVPKIMAALLQANERWLLKKLLQRISLDGNEVIQSKIVALHGYQTLGAKIEKWQHDAEISTLILEVLQKWPTITKNKIMSSKIETHVRSLLADAEVSQDVKDLAGSLLETWSTLEMAYRIPRRAKSQTSEEAMVNGAKLSSNAETTLETAIPVSRLPLQVRSSQRPHGPRHPSYRADQSWRRHESTTRSKEHRPHSGIITPIGPRYNHGTQSTTPQVQSSIKIDPISQDLQAIIDAATKKQQEQAAAQKAQEERVAMEEADRLRIEAERRADRARRHQEHRANKERRVAQERQNQTERRTQKSSSTTKKVRHDEARRLEHMLAKFVPNAIAKYQIKLGKEQCKKRAKEIVKTLVAKEMKKGGAREVELSESRKTKIKIYARDFMDKVVARAAQRAQGTTTESDIHAEDDADSSNELSSPADDENDEMASHLGDLESSTQLEDLADANHIHQSSKRAIDDGEIAQTSFDRTPKQAKIA